MKSNVASYEGSKAKFSELFSETNPELYKFLSEMIDGLIKNFEQIPKMSEENMERMARAIEDKPAIPDRKKIFENQPYIN